jgi:hypothetical protein
MQGLMAYLLWARRLLGCLLAFALQYTVSFMSGATGYGCDVPLCTCVESCAAAKLQRLKSLELRVASRSPSSRAGRGANRRHARPVLGPPCAGR